MCNRPYNSLRGAITRGPKAKPRRYTDTTKVASVFEVSWKLAITKGTPGANIDDASGLHLLVSLYLCTKYIFCPNDSGTYVMKVIPDRAAMFPHFNAVLQFIGF
jgi:hypothetical protein